MSRSERSRAPLWLSFGFVALACSKGPPPDQVRVELPELITSADPVHATVYARRAGASSTTSEKVDYSVTPADLAVVSADGNLTCKKSGDAKLTASIQGVQGNAGVKCRLVESIDLGELPPFDLAKPPVTLSVRPLGKAGAVLDDVPVTISAESPRVVSASGSTLTPLAVGETKLTLRAGGSTKVIPVRVVRSITSEALPLEGGRRIYFSLPAGKFELAVELPVEHKLTVEWRGAPYCAYSATGKSHVASCVLQNKGGAVVNNPAFLLTGATTVSNAGITLREVP